MREFFGFGGYIREAEGYLSWQHLLFVTVLVTAAVLLAVYLGRRNRTRPLSCRNRVLIAAAISIDTLELFKIVLLCFRSHDAMNWLYNLPLFLCSIQLIALPLAAFSKGRVKDASLDFVSIFGVLGMILGTYGAGNNYSAYPVLSFDNVVSGVTHAISGFASLYILISGMASLKKRNILLTFAILTAFCAAAYAADLLIPYNYMFLIRGDGTPYDIVFNAVNGNPVLYPLCVVGLFLIYIAVFYLLVFALRGKRTWNKNLGETPVQAEETEAIRDAVTL